MKKSIATSKQLIIGFLWRFIISYTLLSLIFGFVFSVINTLSLGGFGYFGNPLLVWNIIFGPAYLFILLLYCLRNGIKGAMGKCVIENAETVKFSKAIKLFVLICIIITFVYSIVKYTYDMNTTREFLNKNSALWSEAERHELYMSVKEPYVLNGTINLGLTSALYVLAMPLSNRIIRKYEKR